MDRARRKEILVGAEDFVKIRTGDYYYVDKTGFIRDLLQKKGEVTLFTRPRRFGKTLNMSMLQPAGFRRPGNCQGNRTVREIYGQISSDFYKFKECRGKRFCIRPFPDVYHYWQ